MTLWETMPGSDHRFRGAGKTLSTGARRIKTFSGPGGDVFYGNFNLTSDGEPERIDGRQPSPRIFMSPAGALTPNSARNVSKSDDDEHQDRKTWC